MRDRDRTPSRRRGPGLRAMLGLALVGSAVAVLTATISGPRVGGPPGPASASPGEEAFGEGFEPRDANTRAVGIAMAIGAGVIAVSIGGIFWLLAVLHAADRQGPTLTSQQTATITPPGPPLQSDPLHDVADLRGREAATLSTYRWIDADHQAAQVPIARAMAMVVGRPLDPPPKTGGAP